MDVTLTLKQELQGYDFAYYRGTICSPALWDQRYITLAS